MRLVSDLNDDVLLGIAAVFPENVDASDISCAVFDADAQGGKIVAVPLPITDSAMSRWRGLFLPENPIRKGYPKGYCYISFLAEDAAFLNSEDREFALQSCCFQYTSHGIQN